MFDLTMDQILSHQKSVGTVGESIWFYDNTVQLIFDRKRWLYMLVCDDGSLEPQYGVTGTCHIIDKSAPLMAWAVKRAMLKLRRMIAEQFCGDDEGTQIRIFMAELDRIIAEAKKAADEEKDEAGEVGHQAHEWIEEFIRTFIDDRVDRREELLARFPEDERAANACIAAIDWMLRHNVRWAQTERRVYSRQHKYAGTMDGLAWVSSCSDRFCCPVEFQDRLSVIDWKTSNHLYIEYLLQTAAYWQAFFEETNMLPNDRWIIRLGKEDAEFDPWHAEGIDAYTQDWDAFKAALNLKKTLDIVEDRMLQQRRVKRSELKKLAAEAKAERLKLDCGKDLKCTGKKQPSCGCEKHVQLWKENHGGNAWQG